MQIDRVRLIASGLLFLTAMASGAALAGEPASRVIEVDAPEEITSSARREIPIRVALPATAGAPVLLRAKAAGTSLEIVRPSMTREDSTQMTPHVLRFGLPVVAQAVGTTVLTVTVIYYECAEECAARTAEARAVIRVTPDPRH